MSPKRKDKPESGAAIRDTRRLRTFVFIAIVIVALAAGAGVFYYNTYVAPFHRVIITVDNQTVRMDYFLKRIKMSGAEQAQTLQQVTYEKIVKLLTPQYNITASQSDVDEELKKEAAASSNITSDSDFAAW